MDAGQTELRIAVLLDEAAAGQGLVREAMTDFKEAIGTLQQEVRSATASSMREALHELQADINSARGVVGDLQKLSLWRVAWQHVWVALVAIAMTLLAVWWYVPTVSQMQAMRTERAQLQASIEELSRRGGRIVMNTCGKRLCVEASTDQGNGVVEWRAAWNTHGVPLVIPKGY